LTKKYYSHGIKYFSKWRLLSLDKIDLLASLNPKENNFYSIHNYYPDGSKGCPAIYYDLDRGNAYNDMLKIKAEIEKELGVTPEVWDSGGKGYHILVPYEIKYNKCEKVAKYISEKFSCGVESLDTEQYKTKQMWRIPNTFNPKGNRNKTLIYKYSGDLNEKCLKELIQQGIRHVEEREKEIEEKKKLTRATSFSTNWENEAPPCILKLLKELPPLGVRHNSIVLLARFFKNRGIGVEEAINWVIRYPHYLYYENVDNKISKVFESVYNSDKDSFGCKGQDILLSRCEPWCIYFRG